MGAGACDECKNVRPDNMAPDECSKIGINRRGKQVDPLIQSSFVLYRRTPAGGTEWAIKTPMGRSSLAPASLGPLPASNPRTGFPPLGILHHDRYTMLAQPFWTSTPGLRPCVVSGSTMPMMTSPAARKQGRALCTARADGKICVLHATKISVFGALQCGRVCVIQDQRQRRLNRTLWGRFCDTAPLELRRFQPTSSTSHKH